MKSTENHQKLNQKLIVAYRTLPRLEELDFAVVRTLDVHEVLGFLAGPPLFSAGRYIERLYASDFRASEDYTRWTFQFRDDARFSDGSPLTAEHWYHSIARTIRVGAGVHFNPRKDLIGAEESKEGYCEGLVLKGNSVSLELTAPNKHFPRLVGKIEAAILPIRNSQVKQMDLLKPPGAGPYCIEKYERKRILLKLNPNFPGHQGRAQFPEIELLEMSDEEAIAARIRGDVDFISPSRQPEPSLQSKLTACSQVHRDFGQTIFLSFRSHTESGGTPSPWLQNIEYRRALVSLLRAIPPFEGLEKTTTLLMGAGLGRLNDGPALKTSVSVTELPALALAAVDRPYSHHVVDWLAASGLKVNTVLVNSFNGLYEAPAAHTEALLGWNDFCAEDPYISLYNALNPDRPLFPDDGTLRAELTAIQQEDQDESLDRAYQKLHEKILSSASVIPIYWYWMDSYASPRLNLSTIKGSMLWTLGTAKD